MANKNYKLIFSLSNGTKQEVQFAVPAGADGYTPVKGTDYWTASDKAEIVQDTLAALPTWTGGNY